MQSIIRNKRKEIQQIFESNRSTYGNKKAEEFRAQAAAAPLVAHFDPIGCVSYTIPIGPALGQTAFIYGIYKPCEGPTGLCAFYMTETGVFEGEDLKILEPISGTFAR